MKIIINTKNVIPVEIGELLFHVNMDDASLDTMKDKFETVATKLQEIKAEKLTDLKDSFIEALDVLLGEGSGVAIYTKYPSTVTLSEVTKQLLENLTKEFQERFKDFSQTDVMNEYIKKK